MSEGKPRAIPSTEYQKNLGAVMHDVTNARRTVIVTVHGRPHMALLCIAEYDELMEAKRQLAWVRLARLTTDAEPI